VGVLVKALLLILSILSFGFAKQHVFLVDKYNKEIDLEAKIISKIATSSLGKKVKLYIPEITKEEQKIYSKHFKITQNCESANFVFDKNGIAEENCKGKDKLFFTNNYKRLISNKKYYGAFFWNKSRPNIVFIKQRLHTNKVNLSSEYSQFIEDNVE